MFRLGCILTKCSLIVFAVSCDKKGFLLSVREIPGVWLAVEYKQFSANAALTQREMIIVRRGSIQKPWTKNTAKLFLNKRWTPISFDWVRVRLLNWIHWEMFWGPEGEVALDPTSCPGGSPEGVSACAELWLCHIPDSLLCHSYKRNEGSSYGQPPALTPPLTALECLP